MRIKICGITTPEDARYAEKAGADAIGVVVFSGEVSRRVVSVERAQEIFDSVGPFTATVAVSHTDSKEDLEQMLALHPDAIQISHPFVFRNDPGIRVIRVIGRGDHLPEDCDAIIVDESHGRGRAFDLSYARNVVQRAKVPVILAGGLNPENVSDAIRQVQPYAVDVATGVEVSPGIKDKEKILAFIAACRRTSHD
ncbi:MAG: phosphoribosylanthranilate isomerase [Methanoregula sp.]|jgi:phosphoribosylanthranilate isomerase|nr:phosphoribosylanthranilate isomerase [Methanoregula sp.]